MNVSNKNFPSIDRVAGQYLNNKTLTNENKSLKPSNTTFNDIFKRQQQIEQVPTELKFSKHAIDRMESRDINLSKEQVKRLENGTEKAREKGIKESLIMLDNLAFIVNIKNNTVITAVNSGEGENGVYTNIDGAVII